MLWQLERLKAAGCDDITVVAGPHNLEKTKALVPDMQVLMQEDMSLGTRGALLSALPHIPEGPVMIVAGTDLVETSAYQDVITASRKSGVDGAILGKKMETYFPGGYMTLDGERVIDIKEKPGKGNEPSEFVNIVVHVHNDRDALWSTLNNIADLKGDGYSQTEQQLFTNKHYVAVPCTGSWKFVKYPWNMLDVMEELLKNVKEQVIHPTAKIHPTAVIEGPVHIGEGAVLYPHTVVVGPATIGKHVEVRYHSTIRGGSIGDYCVIGGHSEVKGSILHSHVWTHQNYIGDCVIGENVSFGSGFVTGNLRLDEQEVTSVVRQEKIGTGRQKFGAAIGNDVRIGFHSGTNPGVKIGGGTFIGAHCFLPNDVADKSFVRLKDGELFTSQNTSDVPKPSLRDQHRGDLKPKS